MKKISIYICKFFAIILLALLTFINSFTKVLYHIIKLLLPLSIVAGITYLIFKFHLSQVNKIILISCCVALGYITILLFVDVIIKTNMKIIKNLSRYVRHKKSYTQADCTKILKAIESL